jgi:hypothetical protein
MKGASRSIVDLEHAGCDSLLGMFDRVQAFVTDAS